jgi:hypothetical protein
MLLQFTVHIECGRQGDIGKYVNDMGKNAIEANIWTNKGEWTVEN